MISPPMRTINTVNPFTGKIIARWELMGLSDVLARAQRAREANHTWRQMSLTTRAQRVREALNYFAAHREAIAQEITAHMGRPLVHARREIDGLLERGLYLCDIAAAALAPEILPAKNQLYREICHEPHGVVLVIAAWNYPLLIAVNGVVAALLAGNAVLLKHATRTLSIGDHFARAFGLFTGDLPLVQHLVIDHRTTARLIESGTIQHVAFTGSVAGGEKIALSAAQRFLDSNLELGGKDGAYVAPDADIAQAADLLVEGAMYNAGQCCCSIERVYVHAAVFDKFIAACRPLVASYTLGDPLLETTTLGPLAVASSARVLKKRIAEAVSAGARILVGGKARTFGRATFFEPTLLTVNRNDLDIMQEENFGPILSVMKVADEAAAIEHINDSKYGLTAVVCTASRECAERFAAAVHAGTIFMNRCDYLDPALPWTGVKASGRGVSLSRYGLLAMTYLKAKHFRTEQP